LGGRREISSGREYDRNILRDIWKRHNETYFKICNKVLKKEGEGG
jgi:hypothetical protein